MKKITFYVREKGYKTGEGESFDVQYSWKHDHSKEDYLKHYDQIVGCVKKDYPDAEFIDAKLTTTNKSFTKKQLMAVGQELASVYGGVCTGVKTFPKSVQFDCNEYGDEFTTTLTYDEIREDYAYAL